MGYLALVLAGILSGGIVFGAKILEMNGATPFELMLFPSLLGTIVCLPFIRKDIATFIKFPTIVTLLFMLSELAVTVGEYVPLFLHVSVTLVLLLVYMQPVWTILIERFYFKHQISLLSWWLVGFMVLGLLLLINPFAAEKFSILGMFLALLAGVGESVWIIVSKYFSKRGISPLSTYWCACLYTVVPLALMYLAANDWFPRRLAAFDGLSFDLGGRLWLWFLIYGLLIYLPANVLVFVGNKDVPAGIIGMILLLEPVVGIALDVIFLHNPLTWNLIVGGLIILGANIILIAKRAV